MKDIVTRIIYNALSIVFILIPRDKHLWITGKILSWDYTNAPPAFFDNSKYFYLYLVTQTNEKVYWISSSKKEIDMMKAMGLPVLRFPSIRAIFYVLRAKYSFHHYGTDQINPILQRGMIQLDFWHGTPLKKIRYDIIEPPVIKDGYIKKLLKRRGKEYVFSTSEYLSKKILQHAFNVCDDQLINFGYPRMDVLGLDKPALKKFCADYSNELITYIDQAEKKQLVLLYMPTFRDDDPNYFVKANIDWERLNEVLERCNGVIFIKLHPLTVQEPIEGYKNIVQINNDVDVYPFLPFTTHLVTDYSSIMFDYLALDKEMIFIPYDFNNYISNRPLYFDYDEIIAGKKYSTFDEFISDIENISTLCYKEKREKIRHRLLGDYHFDACKRTYEFFKSM